MEKQETVIHKAKRLVRQARLPRFLNKYGPKDHPLWEFLLCRLVATTYRLSWRRAARFMQEVYGIVLHWTTWQKAIGKWPAGVLHALARASAGNEQCSLAAIDGTTFGREDPSHHYLHRIDREGLVSRPVQGVLMIDIPRRKFLALRFRARPRGEKCDVPYLLNHSPVRPDCVLMDKGFDSEPLHSFLRAEEVCSVAPVREGCEHGQLRKQLRDCFDWALYWQRSIVESMIGALKRLFGTHTRARTARGQCVDIYSRIIAYNIGLLSITTFYAAAFFRTRRGSRMKPTEFRLCRGSMQVMACETRLGSASFSRSALSHSRILMRPGLSS